ncbi:MAG: RraA family protein [Chloroflexota bacterium]
MPDDVLERYRKAGSATVYIAVYRQPVERGEWFATVTWQRCLMKGVRQMRPGHTLVGRARTLRFVPPRPDLLEITRQGERSPEYLAMGACGPGDVLVVEAHSQEEQASILGNMKTRQLWHNGAEGVVTDGAIRDLDMIVNDYDLGVFAGQRSPAGNLPWIEAYEAHEAVNCGGILVLPGDVIVADDDGAVVVPCQLAERVIDWIEEQDAAEQYVIGLIDEEKCPPGRYYPISEEIKNQARGD